MANDDTATAEAMREVTVEVTQEDIDRGARGSCYRCPIALAIDRIVGHPVEVDCIEVKGCGWRAFLPDEAGDFVEFFDNKTGRVAPFTFTLSVPASLVKPGGGEGA